jgi:hypothetical protein
MYKNFQCKYAIVISKVQNVIVISKYTIVIKRKCAIVLSKVQICFSSWSWEQG